MRFPPAHVWGGDRQIPTPVSEFSRALSLGRVSTKGEINAEEAGYCDNRYFSSGAGNCPLPVPGYFVDWSACNDNWLDGLAHQHNDAKASYLHVCPATGPVSLLVNNSDANIEPRPWHVPQDTIRDFYYDDPNCRFAWNDCPTIRADVLDAQGDRFHFKFSVDAEW
jgi:hypothetical protein